MKHLHKNPSDSGLANEMQSMSQIAETTIANATAVINSTIASVIETVSDEVNIFFISLSYGLLHQTLLPLLICSTRIRRNSRDCSILSSPPALWRSWAASSSWSQPALSSRTSTMPREDRKVRPYRTKRPVKDLPSIYLSILGNGYLFNDQKELEFETKLPYLGVVLTCLTRWISGQACWLGQVLSSPASGSRKKVM